MKKIILVGYMGSGKTTVGNALSQKLNIEFVDLDRFIEEQEDLKIADIFSQKGEIYFRKRENIHFNELLNLDKNLIISLGGGTPCYANNHLHLQDEEVLSFYLKASIKTLLTRLSLDTSRPLLNGVNDLKSYIGQHLFERSYYYNYSKYIIEINNKSIDYICSEISTIIYKNI